MFALFQRTRRLTRSAVTLAASVLSFASFRATVLLPRTLSSTMCIVVTREPQCVPASALSGTPVAFASYFVDRLQRDVHDLLVSFLSHNLSLSSLVAILGAPRVDILLPGCRDCRDLVDDVLQRKEKLFVLHRGSQESEVPQTLRHQLLDCEHFSSSLILPNQFSNFFVSLTNGMPSRCRGIAPRILLHLVH